MSTFWKTENRHELLTFGYIHEIQKELSTLIPKTVIEICYNYRAAPSPVPIIHSFNAERAGQAAINILNPNAPTGWNGGDYVKHQYSGSNWIIFQFKLPVNITQFAYRTQGDGTHDPKDMILLCNINNTDKFKWKQIKSFKGKSKTKEWQKFSIKSNNISSRYYKWNIVNRYTYWQAYVVAVQFQINDYGILVPMDFNQSLNMDKKRKGNC